MTKRKLAVMFAALAMVITFETTRVIMGNPVIDEIADHGSDGLNSINPCYDPNIFC